jgi:hypothetical protein
MFISDAKKIIKWLSAQEVGETGRGFKMRNLFFTGPTLYLRVRGDNAAYFMPVA